MTAIGKRMSYRERLRLARRVREENIRRSKEAGAPVGLTPAPGWQGLRPALLEAETKPRKKHVQTAKPSKRKKKRQPFGKRARNDAMAPWRRVSGSFESGKR